MPFLKPLILFSPIMGIVTNQGLPVEGALVVQEVIWNYDGSIHRSEFRTLKDGSFQFNSVIGHSILVRFTPFQPSMTQKITIKHIDRELVAYRHHKTNYDLNSELKNKQMAMDCELTSEPTREWKGAEGFYGFCTFR